MKQIKMTVLVPTRERRGMLSQPSLIEVGESGRVAVRLGGRELLQACLVDKLFATELRYCRLTSNVTYR